MKKTKQHYLQAICFLLMVLTCIFVLLPTKTWAVEKKTYGDFKYCYNEEYEGIEILKYKGTAKTVRIPKTIDGIPVKVIGESCFEKRGMWKKNKTLKKVIIPESVVVIKERAFAHCVALKSVNLPVNLQQLGECTFIQCENLKNIRIPQTLEVLSEGCFAYTGLREIVISKKIRRMEDSVFEGCFNLKKISFENKSKLAFIGWNAFALCGLTRIKLPASVEILEQGVFEQCENLTKVTFEKGSKLKEVGYGCFAGCKNITTMDIPKNVKVIRKSAFINCKNLTKVTFNGPAPKIHAGAFKGVNPYITFEVPKKYKATYTKRLKNKKWFKYTMRIVSK